MNMPSRFQIGLATVAAALALAVQPALAQTFPDKPIRFVTPYPAGGGALPACGRDYHHG